MTLRVTTAALLACLSLSGGTLHTVELQKQLEQLSTSFDGRIGISVRSGSATASLHGDQRFSMQSVVKLLAALAVMDRVDHAGWRLDEPVVVHKADLSVFVQPIAQLVTEKGYRTDIGDLMRRAVVDSDTGATDILIAKLGGPAKIQELLNRHSIRGIHVDRDERHLQTEILGMDWRPEYVEDKVFRAAIAKVPEKTRDESYRKYQTDVRDTSTPNGMAGLLDALTKGKLLSAASTKHLIEVMSQTVTFPDRLKAGLKPGWTLAHKTGTSGGWKGVVAATNDVGILTAPDGGRLAIAVFIGDSREALDKRSAAMAKAARLAIEAYR